MIRSIRRAEQWLARAAGIILFVLVLLTTFDVIGRYLRFPIKGAYEVGQLVLVCGVWAGLAYVTMKRGHINVDILVSRFSPRVQTLFNILACFVGMLAFLGLTWKGIFMALHTARIGDVTDVLELPTFPFRLLIPLGALLASIELLFQLIEYCVSLAKQPGQG